MARIASKSRWMRDRSSASLPERPMPSRHSTDERADARLSLDLLKLSPGQVIAVTGAAGAYGGYIIQLAKAEGLTVIATLPRKMKSWLPRWAPI